MRILIINRRSNGDVFLSNVLLKNLRYLYEDVEIDYLVNKNTIAIAETLDNINNIYTIDIELKKRNKLKYISNLYLIFKKIYKKYDLSINLNANDLSTFISYISSKKSISSVDVEKKKSWWKYILVRNTYKIDTRRHMIYSFLEPLKFLGVPYKTLDYSPQKLLPKKYIQDKFGIPDNYIVLHPSAQFQFRSYPVHLTAELIDLFVKNGTNIVLTGINDKINKAYADIIKEKSNKKIKCLIGKTNIPELYSIIKYSNLFIGMDTLSSHIAASFDKKLIAIYGPNSVRQWSPYNHKIAYSPEKDTPPLTNYGNFTIIQADMPCVPCNMNGCNGNGISECLFNISPKLIFKIALEKLA